MKYFCACGSHLVVAGADKVPAYCAVCTRYGSFHVVPDSPSFPRSYRSPILSSKQMMSRSKSQKAMGEPWNFISPEWVKPFFMTLFGVPGSYKTTQALILADTWPGDSIFLSLEMGLGPALARYIERLEILNVSFGYPGDWDELVSTVRGYDLVVIDSIQSINAIPLSIKDELVNRASKNVLVLSQVNKDGTVSGGMATAHMSDVVVKTNVDRTFQVTKNRFSDKVVEGSWLG